MELRFPGTNLALPCRKKRIHAFHSGINHTVPLKCIVLKNKFFGTRNRVLVKRITARVGNDTTLVNAVVKTVMDMAVNPEVRLWQELG